MKREMTWNAKWHETPNDADADADARSMTQNGLTKLVIKYISKKMLQEQVKSQLNSRNSLMGVRVAIVR